MENKTWYNVALPFLYIILNSQNIIRIFTIKFNKLCLKNKSKNVVFALQLIKRMLGSDTNFLIKAKRVLKQIITCILLQNTIFIRYKMRCL